MKKELKDPIEMDENEMDLIRLKLEKEKEEKEKYALENKEEWKKRGEALIYPEKIEEWHKQVESHSTMLNYGKDVEATFKIMEALESDVPLNEIVEMCDRDEFRGPISHLVLFFSKRGPEFYKELNKGYKFSQEKLEWIEKIEGENILLEIINGKNGHSKNDSDFQE